MTINLSKAVIVTQPFDPNYKENGKYGGSKEAYFKEAIAVLDKYSLKHIFMLNNAGRTVVVREIEDGEKLDPDVMVDYTVV